MRRIELTETAHSVLGTPAGRPYNMAVQPDVLSDVHLTEVPGHVRLARQRVLLVAAIPGSPGKPDRWRRARGSLGRLYLVAYTLLAWSRRTGAPRAYRMWRRRVDIKRVNGPGAHVPPTCQHEAYRRQRRPSRSRHSWRRYPLYLPYSNPPRQYGR